MKKQTPGINNLVAITYLNSITSVRNRLLSIRERRIYNLKRFDELYEAIKDKVDNVNYEDEKVIQTMMELRKINDQNEKLLLALNNLGEELRVIRLQFLN